MKRQVHIAWVLSVAALAAGALLVRPAAAETPPDMGANVSVTVEPNGDTTIDVKSGNLKVKSGGVETRVGPGEGLRTKKGKLPRKVLRAPTLEAPAEDASLGTLEVTFSWTKVPGATKYTVEVSPSPEHSSGRTQTVEATRASLHLEAGTWYWRVVALDGEGTPGKRPMARRLTIDTTPPKLKTGEPKWR